MRTRAVIDQDMLRQMPVKDCGGRFCLNGGPSTPLEIVCDGPVPDAIVGFCAICRRYVCGRCALRQPADEPGTSSKLACRYCGVPLGAEPGSLFIPVAFDRAAMPQGRKSSDAAEGTVEADEWVRLCRDAVHRGVIKTRNMLDIQTAAMAERNREALSLLGKEKRLCRAAAYEAGFAHCATAKSTVLVSYGRNRAALRNMDVADQIWRRLGNRKMLARSLFGRYFLLFGEHFLHKTDQESAEAKLAQLDEMRDAGRDVDQRIVDIAVGESTQIRLARGDLVGFVRDLRFASDGTAKIEDAASLWVAHKDPPPRIRTTYHDEAFIRNARDQTDVWGCLNACRLPGTIGLIGIPKGHTLPNFPCPVCRTPYVCLNNYSRITASVPDWPTAVLLKNRDFPSPAREGIAIANFSLLMRDDGRTAVANELQTMAIDSWSEKLGPQSVAFASCLDGVAKALLSRDEHVASLELLVRAMDMTDDSQRLMPLMSDFGLLLACLGKYDDAERALQESLRHSPAPAVSHYWLAKLYRFRDGEGDKPREAAAVRNYLASHETTEARRADVRARLAALGEADDTSNESSADSRGDAGDRARPAALYEQACDHERQGRFDPAVELFDEAAALYSELQDLSPAVACLKHCTRLLVERKQWKAAGSRAQAVIRLTRFLDNPSAIVEALEQEARIRGALAEHPAELEIQKEIEAFARRDENFPALLESLCRQADLLLETQIDAVPAIDLLNEALEISKMHLAKMIATRAERDSNEYKAVLEKRRFVLRRFERVARALTKTGQFQLAIAVYEEANQLRGTALDISDDDALLRLDRIYALDELGVTIRDNLPAYREQAIEYFRMALNELKQLEETSEISAEELRAARERIISHL